MTQTPSTDFAARLAALRSEVGVPTPPPVAPAPVAAPPAAPRDDADLADDGAKAELRSLDLLTVYRQWFNPAAERPGGGNEVNCSCFNTDFHSRGDQNPQFGINTAKNTYYCHACGVRGDIIDLAAVHYGLADADWRCPDDKVHEAVKLAGEELCGMAFRMTPGGWQKVPDFTPLSVSATPTAQQAPSVAPSAPLPPGHVTLGTFAPTGTAEALRANPATFDLPGTTIDTSALTPRDPEEDDEARIRAGQFTFDWRTIVPMNSPIGRYMEIVCEDDTPEEFHFWNYMNLLGMLLGKKAFVPDTKPVYGNLFTCIIGRTGAGKSRSESHLFSLLRKAAPFDETDVYTNGVRIIQNPGSGEYLLRSFIHEVPDPTVTPGKGVTVPMLRNPSVKGLVAWPELSTLTSKASAKGSTLQEHVISLYDCSDEISTGSLTHGVTRVQNPYCGIMSTTQTDRLSALLSSQDAASGFLNRWLFILGTPKQYQPFGKYIDIAPCVPDVKRLQDWAEAKFRTSGGQHRYTDDARAETERFLVERARPLEESGSAVLSRATLTFKKLTLLFSANMLEDEISTEAVLQAESAFEFLMDCLRFVGVQITTTVADQLESAILDEIRKGGAEGRTPGEVRKYVKRHDPSWDTNTINRALQALEQAEVIELVAVRQRIGAPRKRYIIKEG